MLYLAQSGSQNPLLPNLTELIIGAISFFIVFGALAKVLLPRIAEDARGAHRKDRGRHPARRGGAGRGEPVA